MATVNVLRAGNFGFWAAQFGFLLGSMAYWAYAGLTSDNHMAVLSLILLILLPGLTLEAFLILKTASYTPLLSSHMQWFITFFHESPLTLEILHLVWLTDLILVGRVVYLDLVQGGPIRNTFSFLHQYPPLTDAALARICLAYFLLSYVGLAVWVLWAGFTTWLRRALRSVQVREKQASAALKSSPDDKDNHGN